LEKGPGIVSEKMRELNMDEGVIKSAQEIVNKIALRAIAPIVE
jgi:hypothetical protein